MESFGHTLVSVFWFFLPAGLANIAPSLFAKVKFLDTPVDFGKKIRGNPIFGDHKTYRGFVVGIGFAILTVYLQKLFYPAPDGYTLVNYDEINALWLGFLLGFGALFGDLVKSFFKRRLKIPSGWAWAPFDQVDWIVGAAVFSSLMVDFSLEQIITAIIIFGLLHPVVNLAGWLLKIKPNKF